jgi:hypothetical protein
VASKAASSYDVNILLLECRGRTRRVVLCVHLPLSLTIAILLRFIVKSSSKSEAALTAWWSVHLDRCLLLIVRLICPIKIARLGSIVVVVVPIAVSIAEC